MGRTWALRLALVAAVTGLLGTGSATAQQLSRTGTFGITPAQRTVVARPPVFLGAQQVFNRTAIPISVRVLVVILGQRLDGGFTVHDLPIDQTRAGLILTASPRHFTLAPGQVQNITQHWKALIPRRAKSVAVGVEYRGTPRNPRRAGVKTIFTVVGANLLRLPGPIVARGALVGLRGEQAPRRHLRFFIGLRNTGQDFNEPQHRKLRILDARGRTVAHARYPGGIVLPGYQREYSALIRKVLPAGRYTAVASAAFGRTRHLSIRRPFTLVGPGELPTTKLAFVSLQASGEDGDSAHVRAVVRNTGNRPTSAALRASLAPFRRGVVGRPRTSSSARIASLPPGRTGTIKLDVGTLSKGQWTVTGNLLAGRTSFGRRQVTFAAAPAASLWSTLRWVLLVLAIIGAVGGLVYYVERSRRERRRLREALEAAHTGTEAAPAPPSGSGRVDINTANEDEFQTLPGVGAAMAARIVAERESGGPFASLADLRRVSGVGDARIKALRGKAEVTRAPAPKEPDRSEERRRRREEAARRRADAADRRKAERRRQREEARRRETEEAGRHEREEADRREREEAERHEREEAERRAEEEAQRREHEALIRLQREEAERREREVALAAREDEARRERQEAERLAREEAERRRHEEAEEQQRLREEAERRAREESEQRERAREEAERLEPEAAPVPQAPPAERPPPWADPNPVDLNTADVAELTRLPGVGRGAARRIVAHRESNGRFASVRDLEQVEGFDAGRVARIARRATVS